MPKEYIRMGDLINYIWNNFGDIANKIILGFLAVETILKVLRNTGLFPRDNKLFSWLYNDYDKELLKKVFLDLGYSERKAQNNIQKLKKGRRQNGIIADEDKIVDKLLFIIGQFTTKFQNAIGFGEGKKSNKSNYYINTMEAVQNTAIKEELANYLLQLVLDKEQENSVDFVLVPKGGNPLLGLKLAEALNCELLIGKDSNDSAQAKVLTNQENQNGIEVDNYNRSLLRYEGCQRLLNMPVRKGKKLYGIAVDDNTAGGSLLLSVADGFNNLIDSQASNIEKIKNCYVLFKLVKIINNKEVNIDQKFQDRGLKLYRYFDLSEEDKKNIYDDLHVTEEFENDLFYTEEIKNKISNIRKNLKKIYFKTPKENNTELSTPAPVDPETGLSENEASKKKKTC